MNETIIIYDSFFGNTKKISQAMANAISDHVKVDLRKVGEVSPDEIKEVETLIIGSPTRKFNASEATVRFLKLIPKNSLNNVRVAAFDTRNTQEELNKYKILSLMVKLFGYAAEKISNKLRKLGGIEVVTPQGFYVNGIEGPLVEGELERAAQWAQQIFK